MRPKPHISARIDKVCGDLADELDGGRHRWVGVARVQVQEPDARLAAATLQGRQSISKELSRVKGTAEDATKC